MILTTSCSNNNEPIYKVNQNLNHDGDGNPTIHTYLRYGDGSFMEGTRVIYSTRSLFKDKTRDSLLALEYKAIHKTFK